MIRISVNRGIKVAGHTYPVKHGKAINDRLKEGSYYGRTYHTERQILVDDSLDESVFSNTFVHEAIHAIDTIYDIKMSESQVKRLANGIHQVMEGLGVRFVSSNKRK